MQEEFLGVTHLKSKKGHKALLSSQVANLAGADVVFLAGEKQPFSKLVGQAALAHKPADMLDRGRAVGTGATEPALPRDFNHDSAVALELYGTILKVVHAGARVVVIGEGRAVLHHGSFLLSFYFVPFGTII